MDYAIDGVKSVVAAVPVGSTVPNHQARYRPYGEDLWTTGTYRPSFGWVGAFGYLKTSRPYIDHYIRARHYSARSASWLSMAAFWPMEGAYQYGFGSPVVYADFTGLYPGGLQLLEQAVQPLASHPELIIPAVEAAVAAGGVEAGIAAYPTVAAGVSAGANTVATTVTTAVSGVTLAGVAVGAAATFAAAAVGYSALDGYNYATSQGKTQGLLTGAGHWWGQRLVEYLYGQQIRDLAQPAERDKKRRDRCRWIPLSTDKLLQLSSSLGFAHTASQAGYCFDWCIGAALGFPGSKAELDLAKGEPKRFLSAYRREKTKNYSRPRSNTSPDQWERLGYFQGKPIAESVFIEVKATKSDVTAGDGRKQIAGMIDYLSADSPAALQGVAPQLIFITTSNTGIGPDIKSFASNPNQLNVNGATPKREHVTVRHAKTLVRECCRNGKPYLDNRIKIDVDMFHYRSPNPRFMTVNINGSGSGYCSLTPGCNVPRPT